MEIIYKLVACHFIGDYALQTKYIAETKGTNWWNLIAHCVLYSVPFAIVFGINWQTFVIIGTHIVVNMLKARYHAINDVTDQLLHMATLAIYLF